MIMARIVKSLLILSTLFWVFSPLKAELLEGYDHCISPVEWLYPSEIDKTTAYQVGICFYKLSKSRPTFQETEELSPRGVSQHASLQYADSWLSLAHRKGNSEALSLRDRARKQLAGFE